MVTMDILNSSSKQGSINSFLAIGRYGSYVSSSHRLTFLPASKTKYIHYFLLYLSEKENSVGSFPFHVTTADRSVLESLHDDFDASEVFVPVKPKLTSASILYQPHRHQLTIQLLGENLDAVLGRFAELEESNITNRQSCGYSISCDPMSSVWPIAITLSGNPSQTLLIPRTQVKIASILSTWSEVIIHVANCDLQEESLDHRAGEVRLRTDFGESDIVPITADDILKPSTSESSPFTSINALHPTMNADFLSIAVIRIAVYGDGAGRSLTRLQENSLLQELWLLLMSLESLATNPSTHSSSKIQELLMQYWKCQISLAKLRTLAKVVFTELSQKVVSAISINENPALYLARKLTGLVGRVGGGVMLSASFLLMLPSAFLLAPVSSYILQQSAEAEENGGSASSRSNGLSTTGRVGLNLYMSAAGLLSVPALVIGAMGYYVSSASKYALQDPESIQYKQLLRGLLDIVSGAKPTRSTQMTTSAMRDVLDELCPLEDHLVQVFQHQYPEVSLSNPKTTTQDIALAINLHANDRKESNAITLQKVVRANPILLNKLLLVGRIHAIRFILQNQLLIGFLGNEASSVLHIIRSLFCPEKGENEVTASKMIRMGSWMSDAAAHSHRFEEYMREHHLDKLQLYAAPITLNETDVVEYEEDTGLQASLLANASMSSMMVVLISAATMATIATSSSSTSQTNPAVREEQELARVAKSQHRPFLVVIDHISSQRNRNVPSPNPAQLEHLRSVYAGILDVPEELLVFLTKSSASVSDEEAYCQLRGMVYGMVHNLVGDHSGRAASAAALQFLSAPIAHCLMALHPEVSSIFHMPDTLSEATQSLLFALSPLTAEALNECVEAIVEQKRQSLLMLQENGMQDASMATSAQVSNSVASRLQQSGFWSYFHNLSSSWEIDKDICNILIEALSIFCVGIEGELQKDSSLVLNRTNFLSNLTYLDALVGSLAMNQLHQLLQKQYDRPVGSSSAGAGADRTQQPKNRNATTAVASRPKLSSSTGSMSAASALPPADVMEDALHTKSDELMVGLLLGMNDLVQHWLQQGFSLPIIRIAFLRIFSSYQAHALHDFLTAAVASSDALSKESALEEAHVLSILEETQTILSITHSTSSPSSSQPPSTKQSSWAREVQQYQLTQALMVQLQALTFRSLTSDSVAALNMHSNTEASTASVTAIETQDAVVACLAQLKTMKFVRTEIIVISKQENSTESTTTNSTKDTFLSQALLNQLLVLPSSPPSLLYSTEWRFRILGEAAVDVHGVTRSLLTKVAQEIHANPNVFFLQSNADVDGSEGTENNVNDMLFFDPHICYYCDYYAQSEHATATQRNQIAAVRGTYRALGRLIGFVLRNVTVGVTLPIHFPLLMYKYLLGARIGYRDMQEIQPSIALSLENLLKMDDAELFDGLELTYSVTGMAPALAGQQGNGRNLVKEELPIKDRDGRVDRPVVHATRTDYIRSMVQFHLCCLQPPALALPGSDAPTSGSAPRIVEELVMGVQEMCPRDLWHTLSPAQLQALIEGDAHIDVVQWRTNAVVQILSTSSLSSMLTNIMLGHGTSADTAVGAGSGTSASTSTPTTSTSSAAAVETSRLSPEDARIVDMFWEVVSEMSVADQQRLLCFSIGTTTLPAVTGFAGLTPPFTLILDSHASTTSLPISHTCFHMLVIPRYTQKQVMKEKLLLASRETSATHLGLV